MKRFLAASAILGVATIVLAAWTPVSRLPPASFTAVRFYPAPPTGAGFGEMEQMEKSSVAAALAWEARHQEADGSWKSTGGPGHGFEGMYDPDTARSCDVMTTAIVLLAFLGDGNSPWSGPYRESVGRGWEWLVAQQAASKSGCLESMAEEPAGSSLSEREKAAKRGQIARLNHLWGTIALLEVVAAATFDEKGIPPAARVAQARRDEMIPAAEAAVKFLTEDPSTPLRPARFDFLNEKTINMDELSLLAAIRYEIGCQGLKGDRDWFAGIEPALKQVQVGQSGGQVPFRYSEEGEYWFRGAISTPQSMISFVYIFRPQVKQMTSGAPDLLAHPPVWNPYYEIGRPARHADAAVAGAPESTVAALPAELKDVAGTWKDDIANEIAWFWEGMMFRSFAMVSAATGGDEWNKWRQSIVPLLYEHQRRSGPESGSWDPVGPHAKVFGREVSTAWNAITVQSNCRLQMSHTNWQKLLEDPRGRSAKENLKGPVVAVKCTVCDLDIMSNTQFSKGEGATTYYFCNEEHLQKFEMNPAAYRDGKKPAPDGEGEGSDMK